MYKKSTKTLGNFSVPPVFWLNPLVQISAYGRGLHQFAMHFSRTVVVVVD